MSDPSIPRSVPPPPYLGRKEGGKRGPLAIIAGAGALPYQVALEARARGKEVIVLRLRGFATKDFSPFSHSVIDLLNPEQALRILREAEAGAVVLAGAVHKPGLGIAIAAWQAVHQRDRLRDILRGGDDNLLRGVIRIIEENGFPVIGVGEAAPSLMAQPGLLTTVTPDDFANADIAIGFDALAAMGQGDIGQAVIVSARRVLAIEAAEGTDAMIRRVAGLRRGGFMGQIRRRGRPPLSERTGGVLVKASKLGQDSRVDLPAIGPKTIHQAKRAGLSGIAVEADAVLIVEKEQTIKAANQMGLFILGASR